jgi:hypothetical protein
MGRNNDMAFCDSNVETTPDRPFSGMVQDVDAHKREENIPHQGLDFTGMEIACIHHCITYQYCSTLLARAIARC